MNNEIEANDDEEQLKKKGISKKKQTNHRSVDDMDFDDPEYLQYQNQEDIKQKRKSELLEEREKVEEKKLDEEDNQEGSEDEEYSDNEEEEGEENASEVTKSDEVESSFTNDHWVSQFNQICAKLNKNEIDINQFEKLIRGLITKLDPSRDEDNKKRLCLLTQHLVEFYQSLFNLKSLTCALNTNLIRVCTNFIYELTSKYSARSTKQEPSSYVAMFRKILTDLNNEYLSLKSSDKTFPQLNIVTYLR